MEFGTAALSHCLRDDRERCDLNLRSLRDEEIEDLWNAVQRLRNAIDDEIVNRRTDDENEDRKEKPSE
jgi:hypothetical protein